MSNVLRALPSSTHSELSTHTAPGDRLFCVPSQVLRLGGYLQDPLGLAGSETAGLLPEQSQWARHCHSPYGAGEDCAGICTLPGGQQVKAGRRWYPHISEMLFRGALCSLPAVESLL